MRTAGTWVVSKLTPWERLQLVRDPSRPDASEICDRLLDDTFELRGDRSSGDDAAVVVRLGSLVGMRVVAIGQNRGRISPAGFRKAIRAFGIAGRLGLPVLTIIDTRGADPLPQSEGGGIAAAIAATFEAMLACPTPTLALLTGEGGSGGALAMAVADRVLALANAVFSVIAPEGAAAILYRDAGRAPELAERLRITASDLEGFTLVDRLIEEAPGVWEGGMRDIVAAEMAGLGGIDGGKRLEARSERWRSAGNGYLGQWAR